MSLFLFVKVYFWYSIIIKPPEQIYRSTRKGCQGLWWRNNALIIKGVVDNNYICVVRRFFRSTCVLFLSSCNTVSKYFITP